MAGIITAIFIPPGKQVVLSLVLITLIIFLFSFYRARNQVFADSLPGLASFLLIFSLGLSNAYFSSPENQPYHFINQKLSSEKKFIAKAVISEELKPGSQSARYIVDIKNISSRDTTFKTTGGLLLNLKLDTLQNNPLQPGSVVLIPWRTKSIPLPLNPFQFDYSNYMTKLKVHGQLHLSQAEIKILQLEGSSLKSFAWTLREKLIKKLKEKGFNREGLAVLQALVLGQRRDLDDILYKNYAAAGAIHILAISGLHIGILLLILNFLSRPLERLKKGKILKALVIIISLWSFALLTGLSPSATRAATMFSFIAVGMQLNRKTSTLNSLFLSLFLLLIIDPYLIFQVGFQLSYLAVLGIILFQSPIYQLWKPTYKIPDYFWKLITVSLAAQIGVLPLSLYYFHQFPGLFLLTNLIVLPWLGFILGLGLLVFLLAYINILPGTILELLELVMTSLNYTVKEIASHEDLVIRNIAFSLTETILAYAIILCLFVLIYKTNFKRILMFLMLIIVFQLAYIFQISEIPSKELVIFHKYRESLIAQKQGFRLNLMTDSISTQIIPQDYLRERRISEIQISEIPLLLKTGDRKLLVMESGLNYNQLEFKPEILLLRNNARFNLLRIIKDLKPELIIADGSNSAYYLNKWEATANNAKIPFHQTGEKGAYILRED